MALNDTVKIKEFKGDRDSIDVHHWLRHLEMLASSQGWSEATQICNACAALSGSACYWLDSINITTWHDFKHQLIARFGENTDTVAQKLYNCKQRKEESVAQFTDRFRQLAAKLAVANSTMPATLLLNFFMQGLQHSIKHKLTIKHLRTLDEAIEDAKYLEETYSLNDSTTTFFTDTQITQPLPPPPPRNNRPPRDNNYNNNNNQGYVPDNRPPPPPRNTAPNNRPPAQASRTWPPRGHNNTRQEDSVDAIDRQMEKLQLQKAALQNSAQTGSYCGQMIDTEEDQVVPTDHSDRPTLYANQWYAGDHAEQYETYAYEQDDEMPDAGPIEQRHPWQRVGFNPNQLPTRNAQPAPGHRRPPPPGPQSRPIPRFPPNTAPPPAPPGPPAVRPPANPAPAPRRNTRGGPGTFHIVDQLQSTAAKLSFAELLRLAPEVRAEARAMLDKIDAEQRQPRQNLTYSAMESYYADDDASTEDAEHIQSNVRTYEHQRYDKAFLGEQNAGISVVKAPVHINNTDIQAIVDSGASHTMMSEVLARKLQLFKDIISPQARFYTSSGKLEKPVGKLLDVNITLGSLRYL